jgi:flagellar basal-body rod modification protein FlgD
MSNSIASVSSSSQTSATSANTTTNTTPASAFDPSSFMKILLAELKNQSPLQPMDDTAMMSQMTQLNSLSQLQSMNTSINNMVVSNQFISATNLIGKTVTATVGKDQTMQGMVTGVTQQNGALMLQIGDKEVSLDEVTKVEGSTT